MKALVIASKNKGKIKEFKQLFGAYGIQVKSLIDFPEGIKDVEETGTTFEANARLKAEEIAAVLGMPVLADDSGLVIHALDGRPGVYSARYAGEPTDDAKNNEKVLDEMKDIQASDRQAYFNCVLALAIPDGETIFFNGKCEGEITKVPVGENGFGYDPIFIPNGFDATMGQLKDDEKNKISHRYKALVQAQEWLEKHAEKVFVKDE